MRRKIDEYEQLIDDTRPLTVTKQYKRIGPLVIGLGAVSVLVIYGIFKLIG